MDGSPHVIACCEGGRKQAKKVAASGAGGFQYSHGAIIRGDSTKKKIALVFTGHEFADGGDFIVRTLQQEKIKASFFFTVYFS